MAEYELSDDERQVLRQLLPAIDNHELREELERLAAPTTLTLGGPKVAPVSGTGHLTLSGSGSLVATATMVAVADVMTATDTASVTVVLDQQQTTVLTSLMQNAGDVIKIGDNVVNAGDTWTLLGRWLLDHSAYVAQLPADIIEAFTRWPH